MKLIKFSFVVLLLCTVNNIMGANIPNEHDKKTGNITGEVIDEDGEHLPFASVSIVGTTLGASTDQTGHYLLKFIPSGEVTLEVQYLGYKPQTKVINVKALKSTQVNFQLEKDALGLDEIVVTGDRTQRNRQEATTIVSTISPEIFKITQSATFGEGLNFTPGLRMENDCQNCGFSQVRMNGMEGPYSQILINSRPIFSGLAGVYGLELIPSNMIDRVEVVRGGGSALYGSNAIAGTINVILKDPIGNTYEAGLSSSFIGIGLDDSGDVAQDYDAHFNTSLVSDDHKTGLAIYGFWRDREPFDANNDTFSEITKLKNTTVGSRLYHRFGNRSKVTADFFNIKENRRGGDKFDYVEHEADIAESLKHDILTGALSYDQFFREKDLWSVYVSGQSVKRDSYYGAEQSLADYGNTEDFTYTIGTQYSAHFHGVGELTFGTEFVKSELEDTKLGYLDYENAVIKDGAIESIPHTDNTTVADQESTTFGAFAQYEMTFNKFKASAGVRYDHYSVKDNTGKSDEKSGDVFSPRLTLKYDPVDYIQLRVSYSQGYRAPQIFDEDLHIETSGAKKIIHKNDPDLEQETSQSFMASLDFNKEIGNAFVNFLVEGFYTKLDDAFANEFSAPDANGVVTYTRINADGGAKVQGLNMELNVVPSSQLNFKAGFTIQKSEYEEEQELDEKKFFRTPDNYGYMTLNYTPTKALGVAISGNYTGSMLVPYNEEVLKESDTFFDLGLKINYDIKINRAKLRLFTGMKNIFNSYQDDFDTGIDRDPAYIYGPMQPRTVYFGIKIGNNL